VDEKFCRSDNVLATICIEKEHTGEEIANLIENCIQINGMKKDALVACVRDDAKNMARSCRLMGVERLILN
jgi:hypothetical protein